ncbi:MAG: hypothetical protein ACLRFH_03385 [Opitutales bacterium]
MGFIPKVGNDNRAVSYSQAFNALRKRAHGKRNVAVSKRTGSITSKTKISSRSFSSKATLRSQRKVDTRTPSQLKTIVNLSESQQVFHSLIRRGTISTEAKAVYSAALVILSEVSRCKDFSAANIQKAIKIGLKQAATTTGLKGSVDFFKECEDGGAYNYNDKGQKKTTNGFPKPNREECYLICNNLGFKTNEEVKHPQNLGELKIDLESCQEANTEKTYKFKDGNGKEVPNLKITCPKDFNIESYSGQLQREIDTFNGNVTIYKLKPGTVLTRVFGQDQSIMSSCWCNSIHPDSVVTQAKDLYQNLAVMPHWNGDSNLGFLIVPNDIEIYVTEGTIASQTTNYSNFSTNTNGKEIKTDHTYVFQGGSIQLNILTPNNNSHFAGVENNEIFTQIMFTFRNDKIVNPIELAKPKEQK